MARLTREWCLLLLTLFAAVTGREVHAADWVVTTVAGTGRAEDNGARGKATEVNIGQPFGVEVGPDGQLYITEVQNHRVWRLDRTTNTLAVVAGNGKAGYAGDG